MKIFLPARLACFMGRKKSLSIVFLSTFCVFTQTKHGEIPIWSNIRKAHVVCEITFSCLRLFWQWILWFLIPFIHYNFSAWATDHKMGRQRQIRSGVYVWLLVYKTYIVEEWWWGIFPATILTHPFPTIGSHLCCRTWVLNSSSCMRRSKIWTNIKQFWIKSRCSFLPSLKCSFLGSFWFLKSYN